jgi:hypothetical protein
VTQYFNFIKAIIINNVLMTIWSVLGWAPHAVNVWGRLHADGVGAVNALGRTGAAEILFLSSYQPSSDAAWDSMMYLGTATMFLTGPIYYVVAKRFLPSQREGVLGYRCGLWLPELLVTDSLL